jgi:hypothetical protein
MSSVDVVKRFTEAFNSFDFDRIRDAVESDPATAESRLGEFGELHRRLIHPEIKIDLSPVEEYRILLPPDGRGEGLVAWRELWQRWFESWQTNEVRHTQWEGHGDWVVVDVSTELQGRSSGAEVRFSNAQLWRVQDGRIVGWSVFASREDAVAAAHANSQ